MDADPSLDPVTPPLTFHLSFSPTIIIFLQDYNQREGSDIKWSATSCKYDQRHTDSDILVNFYVYTLCTSTGDGMKQVNQAVYGLWKEHQKSAISVVCEKGSTES